ncbi:MAG: hypothetical protein ACTHKZ_02250 [Lysobacteraceae bacterium]
MPQETPVIRRAACFSVLLALGTAAFASLLSGADFLEATLPGGLPAGNAAAALGLGACAGAARAMGPRGSLARAAAGLALLGGIAWLPVSVALAGNLALNFEGWRGTTFLAWSVLVLATVLGSLGWALLAAVVARCRPARRD